MIIYKITNNVNGKIYIGQTKRRSIYRRFYEHCHKSSGCRSLHNAIVKYGVENFTIEQIDVGINNDDLNEKERYWIDYYDSMNREKGYNLKTGGYNPKYSMESRKRMSENHADVSGEKNPRYGCKISEKMRETLRKFHLGKKLSEDEKLKLKLVNSKRKEVLKIETGEVYLSSRDAESMNNLPHGCISRVCRGKGHTSGGYHWRYINE